MLLLLELDAVPNTSIAGALRLLCFLCLRIRLRRTYALVASPLHVLWKRSKAALHTR
jgi:hypothetical protein